MTILTACARLFYRFTKPHETPAARSCRLEAEAEARLRTRQLAVQRAVARLKAKIAAHEAQVAALNDQSEFGRIVSRHDIARHAAEAAKLKVLLAHDIQNEDTLE